MTPTLEISLFGTCAVRVTGAGAPCEIRGAKHRALIALLATAPLGRRTRTYLQTTLWGYAGYDSGHQNLRRALSDLRKMLGPDFELLFHATNADLELDLSRVRYVGAPTDGLFLDDLNLSGEGFCAWVEMVRQNPEPVAALYRLASGAHYGRPRPRITALPLTVLGDDPQLRVMADWTAEECCRALSRSNLLTVISHLSGRAMASRMVSLAEVRDTLDTDYVLAGTLRRQQGLYVADFDFLDARSGDIMWNRHLSCPEVSFIEELHGRLINVIQSIGRSIADATIQSVSQRRLPEIADHQLVLAGVSLMHRPTMRDFLASRDYLTEAARRMPHSSDPQAWLGKWHVLNVFKGLTNDRAGDTQKALDCTARALDIEPESSFALTIDGFANNNLLKHLDVAEARYSAALDINPNESLSWLLRGTLMAFRDDGPAAIRATDTARGLSPIDPFGYYFDSLGATAQLAAGQYTRALELAEQSLAVNPRHISTMRTRIAALHYLGEGGRARDAAQELRRFFPDFSLNEYQRTHPAGQMKFGTAAIKAMRAAGLT